MSDLAITLIEPHLVWEDPLGNLNAFETLFEKLPKSDLIALPEMFTTGFSMNVDGITEEDGKKTLEWMHSMAGKYDAAIAGSIMIGESAGRHFNRFYFITPEGKEYQYDKRHLFSFAEEDKYFVKGQERIVVEFRGWKILPLICYDLRFPIWSRNNPDDPFDLILYTANWPMIRQSAWDKLLPARAIENACYVAGINRIGKDEVGISYLGGTAIYDQLGTSIETKSEGDFFFHYTLDNSKLLAYRKKFPILRDGDSFTIIDGKL